MNVNQMQVVFSQKLQNDHNLIDSIPSFDIEYYLTEGQRRVYEKYYELFETDEKARKVLNYLVISNDIDYITGVYSDQTGAYPYGEFWKLPDDFAYSLKEEVTININSCEKISTVEGEWLRVYTKPINLDYYSKNVSNPFKKPYSGMVWRLDVSNSNGPKLHMLITGGNYKVKKYHLTYLAYPTNISILNNVDSCLSEVVHQDIVDEAIKIALEVIQVNKQLKQVNK